MSKKPVYKTKPIFDLLKRLFYIRMDDKKTLTIINLSNKNVCSVRKYHNKELKKKEKESLIMKQVSEKTIKFLKNNVKDLNSFIPLNDDKRFDLLEHVENMFVIPLANATSDNQLIDEELLNNAEDVIDDLNMEDLDFEDFNKRIK